MSEAGFYDLGQKCFAGGYSVLCNPCERQTVAWCAWNNGWWDACDAVMEDKSTTEVAFRAKTKKTTEPSA